MTLTIGTGPFGDQGDKSFNFEVRAPSDHLLYFEDSPRRVRVVFGGETVADSRRAKLLHEAGLLPVYYFPIEDVRMELLEESDHTTHCPYKGDASYWSVRAGVRVAENAVWSYLEPIDSAPPIAGYLAFYWRKMDHWYEEDEEVFVASATRTIGWTCWRAPGTSRSAWAVRWSPRRSTRLCSSRPGCRRATTFLQKTCAGRRSSRARRLRLSVQGCGILLVG